MIPSRPWAQQFMAARSMPAHIVRHSEAVRLVSILMARSLIEAGLDIDLRLVDRAALLHDICKADTILHGGDHALMGRKLLEEQGYPRVAAVIGQHVRLESLEVNEAMVVNYSDKRVMHDRVVSLQKRFVDLMDRYGTDDQRMHRIMTHYAEAREVERILVSSSGMDPALMELLNLVAQDHAFDGGNGFL